MHFISPSSPHRAKISVHLMAQAKAKGRSLEDKKSQTIEEVTVALNNALLATSVEGGHAKEPVMIRDVHAWKALQMSAEVRPVKQLEEYMEDGSCR